MTSKQRVLAALNHTEPDRVPLGEIEIDGPIVEAVLGRLTFYRAGLRTVLAYCEGRRDEVVDSMKRDYVEFVREIGLDMASFAMEVVPDRDAEFYPLEQLDETDYRDLNGNVFRHSRETDTLVHLTPGDGPIKLMSTRERGPGNEYSESELEFAQHVIDELGETHFIVAPGHFSPPSIPYRSADGILVEGIVSAVVEGRIDEYREERVNWARQLSRAAAYWRDFGADAVWSGQDIGDNRGTFIDPDTCRRMLLPVWAAYLDAYHAESMPCIWHACGNNRAIWDQFVEAGIDVYQAIQEEEPLVELKRLHGDDFTPMGGVSCRTLDVGTPSQAREQVRRAIGDAAPGGGFILSSSHSLHAGVKLRNLMAMLEAWHEFR